VTAPAAPVLELTSRAAVLATFDLAHFAAGTDVTAVVTFLQERCQPVDTPAGEVVWTLTDRERQRCFERTGLSELRAARAAATEVEQTPVQAALDRSLAGGWTPAELATLTPEQARALSVVAGWWAGHHPGVPAVPAARLLVDRLNLFADLRAMAADHFVDRIVLLNAMQEHFRYPTDIAFAVHGLGGIGKSALLAKHVVWAVDDPDGPQAYAAVLDFDDPSLNPIYPLDLCHRIITLVCRQADGDRRARLERLAAVAQDAAETARHRGSTSSRAASGKGELSGSMGSIHNLVRLAERPILIVFDTAEQVQRRGPSAVSYFTGLVEGLASVAGLRVVVSGRADLPELAARHYELAGLDRESATRLLAELSARPIEAATADAVTQALGTSPLTIRLAARLLSDAESDPGDLFTMDLHAERINGELYRRVLKHIRDPDVRKLAHPGLVLRRITPDVIRHVLAKPCQVALPEPWTADDLFARLSREAMLVDRSRDDDSLVHRADVRRVMLPQLLADRREVAARIQRSAVRYYAARSDPASKVEELYHRLMLDQKPATLAGHWDARAAEALVGVRDEFPHAARLYLTRRLPETYLDDDDRRRLGDDDWVREIEPQVARFLAAGNPQRALGLLRERRKPDGRSLLPALEIEALEAVGDLPAAITIAAEHRRGDAIANNQHGVAVYTQHVARLLERAADPAGAEQALVEALGTMREPNLNRLGLIVALLGLRRRRGTAPDAALRAEAAELHRALGDRQVRQVPGLLRDLAAEVDVEQGAVLEDALRTIGVDASPTGQVPAALRELDDTIAAQRGTTGLVAQVARLNGPYEEIVNKPRGETGRALLDVLKTFGGSAGQLRLAVRADYRQEADAALLGREITYAEKA